MSVTDSADYARRSWRWAAIVGQQRSSVPGKQKGAPDSTGLPAFWKSLQSNRHDRAMLFQFAPHPPTWAKILHPERARGPAPLPFLCPARVLMPCRGALPFKFRV